MSIQILMDLGNTYTVLFKEYEALLHHRIIWCQTGQGEAVLVQLWLWTNLQYLKLKCSSFPSREDDYYLQGYSK